MLECPVSLLSQEKNRTDLSWIANFLQHFMSEKVTKMAAHCYYTVKNKISSYAFISGTIWDILKFVTDLNLSVSKDSSV